MGGGGGYHYENWSTTLMIVGTMVALVDYISYRSL